MEDQGIAKSHKANSLDGRRGSDDDL